VLRTPWKHRIVFATPSRLIQGVYLCATAAALLWWLVPASKHALPLQQRQLHTGDATIIYLSDSFSTSHRLWALSSLALLLGLAVDQFLSGWLYTYAHAIAGLPCCQRC
jgi:hypothetical protein